MTERLRSSSRPRCTGRAVDVRAMWLFGLEGEKRRAASRCNRPEGHRGECFLHPRAGLLPPWRTVRYGWWLASDIIAEAVEQLDIPRGTVPGTPGGVDGLPRQDH